MHHRFVYLMAAALVLAAVAHAVMLADVPHSENVEILVDGVPQPRFAHRGRWYIEAFKGREYAIRLRNPYAVRVAVALSVDGLNTIDARETTAADARKWVLGPYETITISGWQTSRTHARRFEFTTEERSYAQALGKATNLGVITAVFFKERVPVIMSDQSDQKRERRVPEASASANEPKPAAEYAATGMGLRTDHAVTEVWLNLQDVPVHTVNIRYEFRPQLVRLGILSPIPDSLQRRERARGFEPGFSPEIPRQR
jgi:hypothetical protein